MRIHSTLLSGFCLLCVAVSNAQEPYTDPAKADADFALQGEYSGVVTAGDEQLTLGVQVIALGKGKFEAVGYRGGLPGAGWDGNEPNRNQGEKSEDGVVTFAGKSGDGKPAKGVLKDGTLQIFLGDQRLAELKKVERKSETLGMKPPEGAKVLFDGTNVEHWKGGQMSDDKLLMQGTTSHDEFGSHRLHIEFRLPYQPEARGQGRGNSGIYLQGRYECQMLDSFGLKGLQNECGGLYSVKAPDLNMCFPPLSWQTYDIDYTAAKYEGDKLVANPRVTIRHNGVVIHNDVELPGERNTTAAPKKAGPEKGPIYLQNHGNPVRYRNIWVVEK
ncbi:MAG: DUF1080 domain-containing protein [Planctomycetales bacterium]|nr:DUF1080 domain-containing protein [Planctomycetales bacterium]